MTNFLFFPQSYVVAIGVMVAEDAELLVIAFNVAVVIFISVAEDAELAEVAINVVVAIL